MKLKTELTDFLRKMDIGEHELEQLVEYFAAKQADAVASVESIEANIASLQKQLGEEQARTKRVTDGIAKFMDEAESV